MPVNRVVADDLADLADLPVDLTFTSASAPANSGLKIGWQCACTEDRCYCCCCAQQ